MNRERRRHRQWLDAQMPSPSQVAADREAVWLAASRRSQRTRHWPGLLVAAAAASVAVVIALRQPDSSRPAPEWDVSFALHVAGRSPDSDVHINLSVRTQETQ